MLPPNQNGCHAEKSLHPTLDDTADLDGDLPTSEAELIHRMEAVFSPKAYHIKEHKIEHRVVRLIKGYFRSDWEKALAFVYAKGEEYLAIEDFEALWKKVKLRAWIYETMLESCPLDWYHPNLKLRVNKSKTRALACLAYRLQAEVGEWFPLGQLRLSKLFDVTQQGVFRMVQLLIEQGWIQPKKVGKRQVLYRCPDAIADAHKAKA